MAQSSSVESVKINNEIYFKISDVDLMRAFFMSIVSDSDHWLFISSNGGLTAGRINSDYSLFPYYTDDKITENTDNTGSKSIFWITKNEQKYLWEPFSIRKGSDYKLSRNLYKTKLANKIRFEEINHDLELSFVYEWSSSKSYGFQRESLLNNLSTDNITVSLIDGIQNIIPYGINAELQNYYSNLVNAYKRCELHETSGVGIFALSAIMVDRAEPSEALKTNVAWSIGIDKPTYLLSSLQLDAFRKGATPSLETDVKGERGSYLLHTQLTLEANKSKRWKIIANVNLDQSGVSQIIKKLEDKNNLEQEIAADIEDGTEKLRALIAAADGLQSADDELKNARHQSNVMFNIMRGGIFDNNYSIDTKDFAQYLKKANHKLFEDHKSKIDSLTQKVKHNELVSSMEAIGDVDLIRLTTEYLPLKFSRRHGDPSRPWNRFSINIADPLTGKKILDYQGNWRDIFQNWEATAHSYPAFIKGMIYRFLNASTFDGYNPYRVTKDGFDWESIEEDDPWSYIGYWGDHQVIYLLKFLEFVQEYQPDLLLDLIAKDHFVYANVPYKIKPYDDIKKNSKDTVDFDFDLDEAIREHREKIGADGALLRSQKGSIIHVSFLEKILALSLSKLSNFIPGGGIWMNTQRPEWNDANNALVGNGISMVTLCYLHRFVGFFEKLLSNATDQNIAISEEMLVFFEAIDRVLSKQKNNLSSELSAASRLLIMDELGTAASSFRTKIYAESFSGKKVSLSLADVKDFFSKVKNVLASSIDQNARKDGLYHAYNLLSIKDKKAELSYLSEMLEGQVAVLSAKYLSPKQALKALDALKASPLFREDQYSYILYPNKELKGFLKKNIISNASVEKTPFIQQLLHENNLDIVHQDAFGEVHFNGNFRNAADLNQALDTLEKEKSYKVSEQVKSQMLDIFEEVFDHKSFTGRSGTFFGYEGLGSIYWHMVSKLLLAVQEVCLHAIEIAEDEETIGRLLEHFYEINAGIGVHKSPELYGAFPTDPYSHTPANKGAQQPGMTGQVKEDILSRLGELGVFVREAGILFNPCLLLKSEFHDNPTEFKYYHLNGEKRSLSLSKDCLAFTYCQVPVIYHIAKENTIQLSYSDDTHKELTGNLLSSESSQEIWNRTGKIRKIDVYINASILK